MQCYFVLILASSIQIKMKIWNLIFNIFVNLMGENAWSEEKSDARCGIPVVERTNGEFFITLGSFWKSNLFRLYFQQFIVGERGVRGEIGRRMWDPYHMDNKWWISRYSRTILKKSRLSGSIFDNLLLANAGSEEKSDDAHAIPIIWRTNGEFFITLGSFWKK